MPNRCFFTRLIASILAACLIVTAPGLNATQAFGRVFAKTTLSRVSPENRAVPSPRLDAAHIGTDLTFRSLFFAETLSPVLEVPDLSTLGAVMPRSGTPQLHNLVQDSQVQETQISKRDEAAPHTGESASALQRLISTAQELPRLKETQGDGHVKVESGKPFEQGAHPIVRSAEAVGTTTSPSIARNIALGSPFGLAAGHSNGVPGNVGFVLPNRIAAQSTAVISHGIGQTFMAAAALAVPAAILSTFGIFPSFGFEGLSFAFLLGSVLSSNGSSGGENPILRKAQDFLSATRLTHRPGQRLHTRFIADTAQKLGASEPQEIIGILKHLVQQGHVAALSNGMFLYVDLNGDSSTPHALADKQAREGLALFNSGHFARALHYFDSAHQEYEKAQRASNYFERLREIQALRDNAALELLKDVLRQRYKVLAGQKDDPQSRLFEEALQELQKEYFDWDYAPPPLRSQTLELLRELAFNHIQPSPSGDRAHQEEKASGIRLVQAFVERLGEAPLLAQKFLMEVRRRLKPGQHLSLDMQEDIGRQLSLNPTRTWDMVSVLAEQGHLASFSNRTNIYLALSEREEQEFLGGDEFLRQGLELLHSEGMGEHALALYSFARALEIYDQYPLKHGVDHPNRRQAEILSDNAALELLGDAIEALNRQLQGEVRQAQADRDKLEQLDRYVLVSYYDLEHKARPMDEEDLNLAKSFLSRLDLGELSAHPQFSEIKNAFEILSRFIQNQPKPSVRLSPEQELLRELRDQFRPGDRIGPEFQADIARRLGLEAQGLQRLIAGLVQQGHCVVFDGKFLIRLDLGSEGDSTDKNIQDALGLTRQGLTFYHSGSRRDLLLALHSFDQALARFEYWESSRLQEHAQRRQVEVLLHNTALQILRDDLSSGRLTSPTIIVSPYEDTDTPRRLGEYLSQAYFARTHPTQPLPQGAKDWLEPRLIGILQENVHDQGLQNLDVAQGAHVLTRFLELMDKNEGGRWHTESRQSENGQVPSGSGSESRALVPAPRKFTPIPPGDKRYHALNTFARNLTAEAAQGRLSPLIGREDVLKQVIETLGKWRKGNPVLIGPPGVGKTQIVEGLAQKIADGDVPEHLQGVNIFMLDAGLLVAGTSLRGQFEERLKGVIQELTKYKGKVLVFIDELHEIENLGDALGASNAAAMLKKGLARGDFPAIGATTWDDWRRVKDKALKRRVQLIKVPPLSEDQTLQVLKGLKRKYERHHELRIREEALAAAAHWASEHIWDNHLPDSALDVLDTTAARVRLADQASRQAQGRPILEVVAEDVAEVVESLTGIPVHRGTQRQNVARLADELKKYVKGQDHVVEPVARQLQLALSGYKDPNQPLVLAFLGPTGVGKTELARAIAAVLFGSPKNMLQLNMSEFQEKHSVAGLIGAQPGYIGYDDGEGRLTGPVRRKPHQVVLLDEFGKQHQNADTLLLQVMEEGWLGDTHGHEVNFKHTVLILTSNIGADQEFAPVFGLAQGATGRGAAETSQADHVGREQGYKDEFAKSVRPEFLGRVGENVFVFRQLRREDLMQVVDLRVRDFNKHIQTTKKGMQVRLSDEAKTHIVDHVMHDQHSRKLGARQIKKAVWSLVGAILLEAELAGRIQQGERVFVHYDGEKLVANKEAVNLLGPAGQQGYFSLALPLAVAMTSGWAGLLFAAVLAGIYFLAPDFFRLVRKSETGGKPRIPVSFMGPLASSF